MSAYRTLFGAAAVLLCATGTSATAQHGGHGGGHAGGHMGGHVGGHMGGFGHIGGAPHVMHAAPIAGRLGAPIGRINHPANGSFGRVGTPMTHHVGGNAGAFRGGFNSGAFRGTPSLAFPRPSTPYRLTMGPHGYHLSYPTRGTSLFVGYNRGFGGYPFFGYGGYPYLGFGLGYSNFGYPLSYPYGYGGYYGNYGGYYGGYGGYGYVSPAMYAIGGGTAIATGPYQPLTQPFVAGPIPGEAPAGVPAPPGAATVTVIVPEGGQVWFDNNLTQKGGTKWVYTSPALEAGKTYTLTVKARWNEGGKDASLELPVKIRAGDEFTIDVNKLR